MARYSCRYGEIDAVQFTGDLEALDAWGKSFDIDLAVKDVDGGIHISSPHGEFTAKIDNWIAHRSTDDFFAIDGEHFHNSYILITETLGV